MNIKIHSSELSRMIKTVLPCIDKRGVSTAMTGVEISCHGDLLGIRATNGVMSADVATPYICTEDGSFCVDGQVFANVISANSGDVEITTDGKACFVKGAGRTRLPILNVDLPEAKHNVRSKPDAKVADVKTQDFIRCYNSVSYAIATDQTRPVLTGVNIEVDSDDMRMTALDGFQVSVGHIPCKNLQKFSAIVPGAFMKLVAQSVPPEGDMALIASGNRITACTADMYITCVLLSGQWPDMSRIVPKDSKIKCRTDGGEFLNALRAGSVVSNKDNLVKLYISDDTIRITSNGDNADYEAEVPCMTTGVDRDSTFMIAFNQKYLMNAINVTSSDDITLCLNSSVTPGVIRAQTERGFHLFLPVRVTAG